jgi:hypothetical protein
MHSYGKRTAQLEVAVDNLRRFAAAGGRGALITANNGTGALYPSWGSRR